MSVGKKGRERREGRGGGELGRERERKGREERGKEGVLVQTLQQ